MPTLELLKIGSFNGQEITSEILDQIVANSGDRVPVVFGHGVENGKGGVLPPWPGTPAAGICTELQRVGDSVVGGVELSPYAASQWNNLEFHNWSAGVASGENGAYLWHLALLGAEPPAIKDLKILSFSDHGGTVNFIENPTSPAEPVEAVGTENPPENPEKANLVTLKAEPAEMIALRAENDKLKAQILLKQKEDFVSKFSAVAPVESLRVFVSDLPESEIGKFEAFLKSLPPLIPPSPTKEPKAIETTVELKGLV